MKKLNKTSIIIAASFLAAFIVFTVLVCTVDVSEIGYVRTRVGFSHINARFHELTGVHMSLYYATDALSLLPIGVVVAYAALGLAQWVRRRRLPLVDRSILLLGALFAVLAALFAVLEMLAVNYRPILIDGVHEVSYPSSTTLLFATVMPTAAMEMRGRIRSRATGRALLFISVAVTVLVVAARCISGVHWLTDIVGGVLLSSGLVMLFSAFFL